MGMFILNEQNGKQYILRQQITPMDLGYKAAFTKPSQTQKHHDIHRASHTLKHKTPKTFSPKPPIPKNNEMLESDQVEYSPLPEEAEALSYMNDSLGAGSGFKKKSNKNNNKKRFSDEQIRSLESIFESESRLEPRKKLQLAKELGLQPRQVAIWFQNKRARWKSKQLERDYSILRANYNNLASKFEALKKEKQALVTQLQKLNDMKQRPKEERNNIIDGESDNGDDAARSESEGKPNYQMSFEKSEQGLGVMSDDDSSIKAEYFGLEEDPNLVNFVESADGSLTSPEDWGRLNSDGGLFDQSTSDYQWWNFWS